MDTPLLVLIITITIIILYIIYSSSIIQDKKHRKKYKKKLQSSIGTFDSHAKEALKEVGKIKNKTKQDKYAIGNILELNILQADTPVENAEDLKNKITDYYTEALIPNNNTNNTNNNNINNTNNIENINVLNPFMINHIDDFANNNIGNFMLNNFNGNYNGNPIQLFENFNIQPNDAFWEPVIPMLVLTTEANNSTINNALNRKTETIKESKNKEEAIEKFFQKSETHTSDSQNVHDSSVIDNLTVTLGKVKSLNKDNIIKENNQEVHICNEISTYINSMQAEDQFKSNALKTLSEMSSNRPVAHYNDTELSILSLIWERSKDPLNEKNSKNMKDAIVTSLAECTTMTNGSVNTVCITGRVNNVLSSIATLDVDQTIGVAYTQEQYRNEILEKCSNITKSAIENAKKSLNPQMKLLGESYSDPNIIVDIETEVQFKNQLKKEFQVVFDNYSKVLRPHTLNKIKEECLMGIE